jgi:hypothetical protein
MGMLALVSRTTRWISFLLALNWFGWWDPFGMGGSYPFGVYRKREVMLAHVCVMCLGLSTSPFLGRRIFSYVDFVAISLPATLFFSVCLDTN